MKGVVLTTLVVCLLAMTPTYGFADGTLLNLGPEEFVQANGVDIQVPGYSVPSYVDWNNDNLNDLIIGEGGGSGDAKIRIYLNVGTEYNPQFSDYFYAQSDGFDLTCPADGCMGCFPRVDYWDGDERKDLLVGQADGKVKIFLNIGTDEEPTFDGGTLLRASYPGAVIDVGNRATPTTADWNNDGDKDLIVGALDGQIHIYLNCGCGGSPIPPRFYETNILGEPALENDDDLVVPSLRSSPVIFDLDGDGMRDLLTGNIDGQLLFYSNTGSDEEPSFSGHSLIESNGCPIDLPGTSLSRPFLCHWTADAQLDVLIGASDGKVHLYQSISENDNKDEDDGEDKDSITGLPLVLGNQEFVQADAIDIQVPGYSVPSFVDWNNDKLDDIIVGEGGGSGDAKVRIYLNVGTKSNPEFSNYFYAQAGGSDLTCPASGCMGCFPRLDYWDADDRKDLLVGQADGKVKIFLNIGTDENPTFDTGTTLQAGSPGADIDVGNRATPTTADWNNDGMKDLVVGALDGKIHVFLNCGDGGSVPPRFYQSPDDGDLVQENDGDLVVPSLRSSPVVLDLDGDGKRDLLTGNTQGQLLLYRNIGTNEQPNFEGFLLVEANGVPIDLQGSPRSRPSVCHWTADAYFDVLIGAGDGKLHLYQGIPKLGDINGDGNVDADDFIILVAYWLQTDCGLCGGADLNGDANVDMDDLRIFIESWLADME